jgi:apoptosis-inducing factor 3
LVRLGQKIFAVSPHCTHYHGPLSEGLLVGDTVRCPWHHACFDLRPGEALRAPAGDPIACWNVEQRDGIISVRDKREHPKQKPCFKTADEPEKIVILGGGAATVEMLRREGYQNSIVMLSSDASLPYDRPNLSKDYLAGTIPFKYVPLRDGHFYEENDIKTRLGQAALEIDVHAREVVLASDEFASRSQGPDQPHVHTLRSLADCQAIIESAKAARRAVVIGASFIGFEVAASLCARKLEVHVVAPDKRPIERVLGPDMDNFIRALHEEHGVVFHLEDKVAAIEGKAARLESGGTIEGDLVVVGIGVRPRLGLAEKGRTQARPRNSCRPLSRDEGAGHLCRGRHRTVA